MTKDLITITISRGRWSVSRQMDLAALTQETDAVSRAELLADFFDETHHAFALACQHLPDQFAPIVVETPVPQPKLAPHQETPAAPPLSSGKTLCQVFAEEEQSASQATPPK